MPAPTRRIFLSHSHIDNDFGTKLAQDLRRRLNDEGAVWYDLIGLHGGDAWWEKIVEELTARDTFLVVLSPDAMNSYWVRREITIALNERKFIIPILYHDCTIRADLKIFQTISFLAPKSYEVAFQEVLRALGLPTASPIEQKEYASQPHDLTTTFIQQIEAAFAQQDWADVIRKANYLIRRTPEGLPSAVYRLQGLALLEEEEIQQAQEALEIALALVSDRELRLTLLGDYTALLARQKQWAKILPQAKEALRLVPNDPAWLAIQQEAQNKLSKQTTIQSLFEEQSATKAQPSSTVMMGTSPEPSIKPSNEKTRSHLPFSQTTSTKRRTGVSRKKTDEKYTREADRMPIDKRISHAYYKELFWRYYASHALRLSLMLICEEIPNTIAGLILPLQLKHVPTPVPHPEDLPQLGASLVGWLGQSRSFYTFLTLAPSFEHPSDFRIHRLQAMEEEIPKEDAPRDGTLIVAQRTTVLTLSKPVVEVVRRLLEPLYNEVADWHFYFGQGMRDLLDPLIDFSRSSTHPPDIILTNMANTLIHLGGLAENGGDRWRFCCILTPNDATLPLQQRSLVVRAKTREAPYAYKIGATIVSPDEPIISLSLRAFQSGRVIYRHRVTAEDASVAHRELEEPIGSAIAVPVGGEDGLPIAVMYIVSALADAFNDEDQRLLRMIGRMLEELLKTYQVRLQVADKFAGLITNPGVVDPVFADFASESDFIKDVEDLLSNMKILAEGQESVSKEELADPEVLKKVEQSSDAVSFIAIDIDNQTSLTNKYGYQMTKNLSRAVGLNLQRQIDILFPNPSDCKLYHIYADRFFLVLKGVSLEKARERAALLKQVLNGTYQIDALRSSIGLPRLTDSILVPAEITVRLGVASYQYAKLEEILQRYPVEKALASTTALITNSLDKVLKAGW